MCRSWLVKVCQPSRLLRHDIGNNWRIYYIGIYTKILYWQRHLWLHGLAFSRLSMPSIWQALLNKQYLLCHCLLHDLRGMNELEHNSDKDF
jgi:hypothetical protein